MLSWFDRGNLSLTGRRKIVKPTNKLIQIIFAATLLIALTLPVSAQEMPDPMDEYDLVNREDLKALFANAKLGKGFVEGKLSRESYNANQKGKLRTWLNEKRKGLGVAFFRTNGGSYGKLLYTWGIGPKLHLKDIVVFHAKKNLILKSVVLGPTGHIDLDTGEGTHKAGVFGDKYNPDLHFSRVKEDFMFLSETDGARFIFPMN